MKRALPPLSTDQVLAFTELVRHGSIRRAAEALNLSEEGLRSRLLTLEQRLGVSLYEKSRGRRGDVELSAAGQLFLGKALNFIEQARALTQLFEPGEAASEIRVVASHYLTYYLLIDVVRAFHQAFPHIAVRLSTRTEQQILTALADDAGFALAIFAPAEYPAGLVYHPWFSMAWHVVAARGHRLLSQSQATLAELADEPLIVFEPGSTGRQHVLEAFYQRKLKPTIAMEATTTAVILRMVEAGLGVAVLPLPASGRVTRGLEVGQLPIADPIRPIDSGLFVRPEVESDGAVRAFIEFTLGYQP